VEIIDRFATYTQRLPRLERFAARLGAGTIINSMVQIEFGNPIAGGLQTILGAVLLCAATSESSSN
jgi:hypothetical protein